MAAERVTRNIDGYELSFYTSNGMLAHGTQGHLLALGVRYCSTCGHVKPVSEFVANASKKDGIDAKCKTCASQLTLAWQKDNPERKLELTRQWYAKHREAARERARSYYAEHMEERKEYNRRWARENLEAMQEKGRRRRARKAGADVGDVPADVRDILYERQEGRCVYCGLPLSEGDGIHLDHVVPLAQGGAHSMENLVLACAPCNLSKGAKTPGQWLQALLRASSISP